LRLSRHTGVGKLAEVTNDIRIQKKYTMNM